MGLFSSIGQILKAAPTLATAAIPGVGAYMGQTEANVANAQQAQNQIDFQREMSNTAHQREVADLKAAGLNPMLSGTGGSGASTPSGAAAQMGNALEGMGGAASTAMDFVRMKQDIKASNENIKLLEEQQKTQQTQQQLNSAQTIKSRFEADLVGNSAKDLDETIKARTGLDYTAAGGNPSDYYKSKAASEVQQARASKAAAEVEQLKAAFDKKASTYDNIMNRVNQATGIINNATSAIRPSFNTKPAFTPPTNPILPNKSNSYYKVDKHTGEILP
jgi:hypothetical protein